MQKVLGLMLAIAGISGVAMAVATAPVPEISPTSAVSALTLLGGSVLVLRSRRRK